MSWRPGVLLDNSSTKRAAAMPFPMTTSALFMVMFLFAFGVFGASSSIRDFARKTKKRRLLKNTRGKRGFRSGQRRCCRGASSGLPARGDRRRDHPSKPGARRVSPHVSRYVLRQRHFADVRVLPERMKLALDAPIVAAGGKVTLTAEINNHFDAPCKANSR